MGKSLLARSHHPSQVYIVPETLHRVWQRAGDVTSVAQAVFLVSPLLCVQIRKLLQCQDECEANKQIEIIENFRRHFAPLSWNAQDSDQIYSLFHTILFLKFYTTFIVLTLFMVPHSTLSRCLYLFLLIYFSPHPH